MLSLEKREVSCIQTQVEVFPFQEKGKNFLLPVLIDSKNRLLAGYENLPVKGEVSVMVLKDPVENLSQIVLFQEQLNRKKLSLIEKFYFLSGVFNLYPLLAKEKIYSIINFPVQKKEVFDFFEGFEKEKLKNLFARGISSVREMEYFYELSQAGWSDIFLDSKNTGTSFKIALNTAFELLKTGKLNQERLKDYPDLESYLFETRYPVFSKALKSYQEIIGNLDHPSFFKLKTMPFFEGKKVIFQIELKNKKQFEELLFFLNKNREKIEAVFQTLDEMDQ